MKTRKLFIQKLHTAFCALCIVILTLCGCNDWLKPEPLSFYAPENIFNTKKGLEGALVSCRLNIRAEFTGNNAYEATELMACDVAVAGNIVAQTLKNFEIQLKPGAYGDSQIGGFWTIGFDVIQKANTVISRVETAHLTEDEHNAILAEGYFHRAYWYYKLVNQFGDVPFIDGEVTTPRLDYYSHTRSSILRRLRSDLLFATQYLPEEVPDGAVSRAAGNHLLAKICLACCDFDGAVRAASNIINDGKHKLMENRFGINKANTTRNVMSDLFDRENINLTENAEAIMLVEDKRLTEGGTSTGSYRMRNLVPCWWNSNTCLDPAGKRGTIDGKKGQPQIGAVGRGIGRVRTTNYFNYEIWDSPADYRHTAPNWLNMEDLVYNNPSSAYYGQPLQKAYCVDTIYSWMPMQTIKTWVPEDNRPDTPQGGYTNWYVFRLAETYLLRAEAYYWKGELANAMSDLNKIRRRSNATEITDPQKVDIEFILDERARELFFEEPRKVEMTRVAFIMAQQGVRGYSLETVAENNYYYDRMMTYNNFFREHVNHNGINTYTIKPYHILWPIPENAIASNSQGRINQAPGYPGAEENVVPLELETTELYN
jgi:hypothetical protein